MRMLVVLVGQNNVQVQLPQSDFEEAILLITRNRFLDLIVVFCVDIFLRLSLVLRANAKCCRRN